MVVDSQDLLKKHSDITMEIFKDFLNENEIVGTLMSRSKDAYAYYLQMVPHLGESGFYEDLPEVMRHLVVGKKFRSEIHNIQFFRNM